MKKMILIGAIVIIAGAALFASKTIRIETQPSIQPASPFNRPKTEERIRQHAETIKRQDARWDYLQEARRYEDQKEYARAIDAAKQSLEYTNKNDDSAWVSRRTLQRLYEKAGYYDLAMKELEWAESIQTRPDVLKKLAEDRERLEDLIRGGLD